MINIIVTGTEGFQCNGPLQIPLYNGLPGTRVGQIAFDADAVLFTPASPIYWDGTAWIQFAASSATNLQSVTDNGSITTNDMTIDDTTDGAQFLVQSTVGSTISSKVAGTNSEVATTSRLNGEAILNILATNPDGTVGIAKAMIGRYTDLLFVNASEVATNTIFADGRMNGSAATAANDFVIKSQIRINFTYTTATTMGAILNLANVNSLFANYDDVQVTNITDATDNSILFKRTGVSTWDYVVMNKLT